MCTIQMCIRARGEQPRIALIFRGASKTYYKNEIPLYDPRVDVYFQKKAWADRPTTLAWMEKTFAKHIDQRTDSEGALPTTVLFCDNLDSQVQPEFKDGLRAHNCWRHLLVAGETEMLQAIDHGAGAVLKMLLGEVQDEWLDEPGNLDAWEGDPHATFKIDAKLRRVLITSWIGEAWERLTKDPKYKDTLFKCFVTTGLLITADGTDDALIQPMVGLPGGYSIPEVAAINDDEDAAAQVAAQVGVPAAAAVAADLPDLIAAEQDAIVAADEDGTGNAGDGPAEDDVDEDGSVVDDEYAAAEQEEDTTHDAEDEVDSWTTALEDALALDPPVAPVRDATRIPKRLVGCHALVFLAGEWDLVKIESSAPGATTLYRYKTCSSRAYGHCAFTSDSHGRFSTATDRWVMCVAT